MPVQPDGEHDTPAPLELRDPATLPDERVAASEEIALVDRQLRAMGPRYRDVFWMRFVSGYSETEIARRLRLQLSTVKTRTHRARRALRASQDADLAAAA
jgi:RNA polymerase sigma factor (sigma-70 family)